VAAEANNMKNGTSSLFFTENAAKATSLFGPSYFCNRTDEEEVYFYEA